MNKLKLQNISGNEIIKILLADTLSTGGLKSPTHSNISKINLDDTVQSNVLTNATRSPQRGPTLKATLLDEEITNLMINFLDNEINDMTELEVRLSRIKKFDQIKIPFAASGNGGNGSTEGQSSKKNILVKRKYQILSSVTIDLINATSSIQNQSCSVERSKHKK